MTTTTTDLGAWTTDRLKAVRGLPRATQLAAKRSQPILLAEGLKAAPRHTGALHRSLRVAFHVVGGRVTLALTSDDPAALHQEEGGPIYAGSRQMTVPVGVERALWDSTGTRRSAKQVPGLFGITGRDGRRYLVTRSGRNLQVRFVLRDMVYQRGQGWATRATRAAAAKMEPGIRAEYVRHLMGGGEHRP